ncbi:RING finger-containing protein [Spironucleus salmonicida]|uniref:RING finger-containing protein n=1 Tax=Spironucleus salmonicida TaxID=348837 RepID=V6LKW1_9EUKA|nr:RING finger-containing protein [Spironucleus salmonicida]|eukprot:EST45003.1 RING finger-containing protein [Spironucleus salmonicida]
METCPLCLDDIINDICLLDCHHQMHQKCYELLIASSQRTCPVCRALLPLQERAAKDMVAFLTTAIRDLFLEYTKNESLKISAIETELQTKETIYSIQKQKTHFRDKIICLRDAQELVYERITIAQKDLKLSQSGNMLSEAQDEHDKLILYLNKQSQSLRIQLQNTLKMSYYDQKMITRLKVHLSSNDLEMRTATRKMSQLKSKMQTSSQHYTNQTAFQIQEQLISLNQKIEQLEQLIERTQTEIDHLEDIECKLELRLEKVIKLRIQYLTKRRELYEDRFSCDDLIDDIHQVLNEKAILIQTLASNLQTSFSDHRASEFSHETRKFQLTASQYAEDKNDFNRILVFYKEEIQSWEFT